jgi:dephospho-CoA kinase
MIICITGLPGAGKSTAGRILERKGFKVYELGDIVREMMRRQRIRLTPESDREFTISLRRKYGKLVTVKHLFKRVKLDSRSKIAIIGVRSKSELDYIRRRSRRARVVTVAVVAPVKLRFARIKKRGRPDTPRTLAEFIRNRDDKEVAWGEIGAIKSADYIVSGSGTNADLKAAISNILEAEGAA